MRHPTTRTLFSYWDDLRGLRAAPERAEIDPGDLRHILADTLILSTDETHDTTFRLAGTRLCALFGQEMKHRSFVSIWRDEDQKDIQRMLNAVMDDSAGLIGGVSAKTLSGRDITLELLLLPLRHRGKTHSRILGSIAPMANPIWLGLDPLTQLSIVSLRMMWTASMPSDPDDVMQRRAKLVVYEGGRV